MRAGSISGTNESRIPAHSKRTKRGTHRALTGTIRQTSDRPTNRRLVRGDAVAIANPAQEATRTVTGTATPATINEFLM
jgi:hypothetical protein